MAREAAGERLALELTTWNRDIVLCTNGPADLNDETLLRLARNGIAVREGAYRSS